MHTLRIVEYLNKVRKHQEKNDHFIYRLKSSQRCCDTILIISLRSKKCPQFSSILAVKTFTFCENINRYRKTLVPIRPFHCMMAIYPLKKQKRHRVFLTTFEQLPASSLISSDICTKDSKRRGKDISGGEKRRYCPLNLLRIECFVFLPSQHNYMGISLSPISKQIT